MQHFLILSYYLMFMAATAFRDRVITASSPGIAANNAFYAQPAAFEKPVALQCLNRVLRTGRGITAGRRGKRGYSALVKAD